MKKITFLLLMTMSLFIFNSCEEDLEPLGTPYASFEATSFDAGIEEGGTLSKDIMVYTANVTSSDRVIAVSVVADATTADATAYTVPASVTIPGGTNEGVLSISLSDVNLDEDKTLTLKLDNTTELYTGDNIVINLARLCPNNGVKIKLTMTFDAYPDEIYWNIKDADGNIVATSADPAAYGAYSGLSGGLTETFCLASGAYTIEIYDGYSDGGTAYSITADGAPIYALGASDYTGSTSASLSF